MKIAVFVDTNVIIDFLIDREPFANASTKIFDLAEKEKLVVYVSSLCFGDTYYILRKLVGHEKAMILLDRLERIVEVLGVNKMTIRQALRANFKDFEDAIQNFTAYQVPDIKTIVTRNPKDFKGSKLIIQTPEEFLSSYS